MAESAKAHLNRILAETTRRKKIWAEMQKAAREALRAVTPEARRRGIRGQKWLGGEFEHDWVFIKFLAPRRNESLPPNRRQALSQAEIMWSFKLNGSGSLEQPSHDTAYEGYPDLHASDVNVFRAAAVETLMAALNARTNKVCQAKKGKR